MHAHSNIEPFKMIQNPENKDKKKSKKKKKKAVSTTKLKLTALSGLGSWNGISFFWGADKPRNCIVIGTFFLFEEMSLGLD
jgi:hypothetical protein